VHHCALDAAGRRVLEAGVVRFHFSARAIHRALRVARTIADLGETEHLSEALSFRPSAETSALP
jgi:magnesium chelatase family protein